MFNRVKHTYSRSIKKSKLRDSSYVEGDRLFKFITCGLWMLVLKKKIMKIKIAYYWHWHIQK